MVHRFPRLPLWAARLVFTAASVWPCASHGDARRMATVAHVIDGDTVILTDGERVRLLGIDTPERGEPWYGEATEFLRGVVREHRVELEFDRRRRDTYRRLLAHLWLGDTLISELLLKEGMARLYLWPPDTLHASRLLAAQISARRAARGIWSEPAPPLDSLYVIHMASRRFHRLHCVSASRAADTAAMSRDSLLDLGLSPCRRCKP